METDKIAHFKERLETELKVVENDLQSVGRRNPEAPQEWEAQVKDTDTASTEPDERADKFEEFEVNHALLHPLQDRWQDIKRALQKIDDGLYGVCEISGEEIEEERLGANPAARTCEKHMAQEQSLPR
jgi:RNA polymerase-binding transcription factor DksA